MSGSSRPRPKFQNEQNKIVAHVGPTIVVDQTLEQRVRAGGEAALAYARANPDSCRILFGDLHYAAPELAAIGKATHEGLMTALAGTLAPHLAQAGVDPSDDRVRIWAEMVLGGLVAIWRWSLDHPDVSDETIADTAYQLVWALVEGVLVPAHDVDAR